MATVTHWSEMKAPTNYAEAVELAEAFRAAWIAENGDDTTDECPYIAAELLAAYPDAAEIWAGSYDCNPEQYHIVCAVNGWLIDISADQFGGPEVVVSDADDREYAHTALRRDPNAI